MRVHFPERYDAHRDRSIEFLERMAASFGLTYAEFYDSGFNSKGVKEMSEVDDNVPIPEGGGWAEYPAAGPDAPAQPAQPAKRGRPPKPRLQPADPSPVTPTRKPRASAARAKSQAEALERALAFVAPIAKNDLLEQAAFVNLSNKMAVGYNGQVAAGHPIEEELNVAPNLDKLRAALARTGKTLVITETGNASLSIQGERLRAVVPCLPVEELAQMAYDAPAIFGDFNVLKQAFKACSVLADEKGQRVIEASLLLGPNTCTSTNGSALIQYWHGLSQLPPDLVLPKVFCDAIAASPLNIVGLGGTWNAEQGIMTSFTVCFENGAWYKTQTYFDRWPSIDHILELPNKPIDLPEGFFEGIEAVAKFAEESSAVYLMPEVISSTNQQQENAGAVYSIPGLNANMTLSADLLKKIAPFVTKVDFLTHPRQIMFFGPSIRGALMAMSG